ncbi:MAG: nitroreductase family protein [Pseudomonadota bacterium]
MNTGDPMIHALLSQRSSPYAFDPERQVSEEDLTALFEAARWTMSSYNAQPWRYLVGVRGRSQEVWEKILGVLVEPNQVWARNAPVLVLTAIEHSFEHNGEENKAAQHDLGAASASLTFEATSRGISVHQMIGIVPQAALDTFAELGSLEPFTAIAIGYAGHDSVIPAPYAERQKKPRVRKTVEELIIGGKL